MGKIERIIIRWMIYIGSIIGGISPLVLFIYLDPDTFWSRLFCAVTIPPMALISIICAVCMIITAKEELK